MLHSSFFRYNLVLPQLLLAKQVFVSADLIMSKPFPLATCQKEGSVFHDHAEELSRVSFGYSGGEFGLRMPLNWKLKVFQKERIYKNS